MNVISHDAFARLNELDELVEQLKHDGFLIIPNAVEYRLLDELCGDLAPEFASARFGTGPFYGETTKRFGRLFARSRHTEAFARHPLIYAIVEQILAPWRSEEHTSELQSLMRISYAFFCLKKQKSKPEQHAHYMQH